MGKEFYAPFDADLPGEAGGLSPDNPYGTTRIIESAQRLHILSLLVGDRTVQEYLGAHNELSDIEQAMSQAREALLAEEATSISPGLAIRIQANYNQTLGFIRAALLIIEDGLHVRSVEETIHEMEVSLSPFLAARGMSLVAVEPGNQRSMNSLHMKAYEESYQVQRAKEEAEDANLRSELVRQTATGFIPIENWQHSQEIQSYAALMSSVLEVEQHLFQAGAGRQTEVGEEMGVTTIIDKDGPRFGLVRGMVYSIEASLNEGIIARGNIDKHTPAYQYASYLNQFLWAYDRQVVW